MKKSLFISAKMRGVPYYNFQAFDKARDRLLALGFEVFSPADMDRKVGFDPTVWTGYPVQPDWSRVPSGFDLAAAVKRDNEAIAKADGVFVLHEGFADSEGATAEVELAMKLTKIVVYDTMTDAQILKAMGADLFPQMPKTASGLLAFAKETRDKFAGIPAEKTVLNPLIVKMEEFFQTPEAAITVETADPLPTAVETRYTAREGVLDEAKKLITGNRNNSYGPPTQDFRRSADMMTALFSAKLKEGERFKPSDVAWIITLVKASRAQHSPKRDNYVDAAGYMGCGWECEAEEQNKTKGKAE